MISRLTDRRQTGTVAPYLTAHGGLGYMWDVTDNVTG